MERRYCAANVSAKKLCDALSLIIKERRARTSQERACQNQRTALSKALPAVFLCHVEVATFMKGGIPFAKLPYLRGLLEDGHVRLTDPNHLSQLVKFILQDEKKKVKGEIANAEHWTVIFDGSAKLGALVILLSYGDSEWNIQQCVVRLG